MEKKTKFDFLYRRCKNKGTFALISFNETKNYGFIRLLLKQVLNGLEECY